MENHENFKEKMNKMFERAKEKFDVSAEKIKSMAKPVSKTLKGIAAGTVIAAAGLTNVACTMPGLGGEPIQDQTTIEMQEQQFNEINAPYTKNINGFKFHNFFGQEPDIEYETMHEDIAKYLTVGAEYLKQELNNFEKSLDGRLQAEHYFNHTTEEWNQKFIDRVKENVINPIANSSIDGEEDFFPFLEGLAIDAMDPISDFINALDNNNERVYFLALYKFLSTHAGEKEGLGNKYFEQNTALQDSYQAKIAATLDYANSYLPDIKKLESLIDNYNGEKSINIQKVTAEMYTMLDKNAHKVNPEVTADDLMFPIYFSTYGSSLLAAHDYFVDIGYHQDKPHHLAEKYAYANPASRGPQKWTNCYINYYDPADRMIDYIHHRPYFKEVDQSINQQTQQQDDGRTM